MIVIKVIALTVLASGLMWFAWEAFKMLAHISYEEDEVRYETIQDGVVIDREG